MNLTKIIAVSIPTLLVMGFNYYAGMMEGYESGIKKTREQLQISLEENKKKITEERDNCLSNSKYKYQKTKCEENYSSQIKNIESYFENMNFSLEEK